MKYISEDGKIFDSEEACRAYEQATILSLKQEVERLKKQLKQPRQLKQPKPRRSRITKVAGFMASILDTRCANRYRLRVSAYEKHWAKAGMKEGGRISVHYRKGKIVLEKVPHGGGGTHG